MSKTRPDTLGLYISVPFCRSKCTYCNFASGVYPAGEHGRYIERVVSEVGQARNWAGHMGVELPKRIDTIYLGGGTPSILAPELIAQLFEGLRTSFQVDPDAEITVECAPGHLAQPTLDAVVEAGVNRVSLGVQSFIDREAHASGRLHDRSKVLDDIRRLRAAGIDNLNIDLIAGLPGQTFASWDESLNVLIETGVPHASVYMLEVDEDSRLGRELLAGGSRYSAGLVPDDDAIARMYETAIERLSGAGISQYEISNFARPGSESRHNLRYWERRPYLGCGLDASSMAFTPKSPGSPREALRWKTTDDLAAYIGGSESPETAWLSPERQHEEAWFLGLRLCGGVHAAALRKEFGAARVDAALQVADRLIEEGFLVKRKGRICLTSKGRLLSNEVFQQFLGLDAEERLLTTSGDRYAS